MAYPTVIFNHGRESGPWGSKIRLMAKIVEEAGFRVFSRDDTDTKIPGERIERLLRFCETLGEGPIILVGSSMGAYVATVASQSIKPLGLFLLAPAFGLEGYPEPLPRPSAKCISIIHGWQDEVIPLNNVLCFAETHRASLHLVPAGHSLQEELAWVKHIFSGFLHQCLEYKPQQDLGRCLACF
jgi:pimeloyl-ACP methyl ester carboxylesterase